MASLLRTVPLRMCVLGCVAVLSACAESLGTAPDGSGTMLLRVSGETLAGVPGFPVGDSVAVRVVDAEGAPVSGAEVQFAAVAGSGVASPDRVLSDATGVAKTQWILGPAAGENKLQAKLSASGDALLDFTAQAQWGRETRIEVLSAPTSASMPVGCETVQPISVRVLDAAGAPVGNAPVYFSVGENGTVVRTDASGNASLRWRSRAASERVVAKIASPDAATVAFQIEALPIAPNGYAAVGNKIVSSACAEHRFIGMARPGLQWWPNDDRLSNADSARADFTRMKQWGANVVRLPVYQRYWLMDFRSGDIVYTADAYRSLVRSSVERANAAGLDVIIDLHASDRGDPSFDGVPQIQQMADEKHSVPFWTSVAEMFKGNGRVIFQLYNEPNQISWEIWRNGGMIPAGVTIPGSTQSSGIAFQAAGMQALYKAVRDTGAQNMVIINGMHWGYDLARALEYKLDGYNIMYATHPYDYADKQPDQWENAWGYLANTFPVMIAEFGDYTCNQNGYYTKVLDYADAKKMSWVAWAWWAPPADRQDQICGFPALIRDWGGTPSPTGQVVMSRMQSYR